MLVGRMKADDSIVNKRGPPRSALPRLLRGSPQGSEPQQLRLGAAGAFTRLALVVWTRPVPSVGQLPPTDFVGRFGRASLVIVVGDQNHSAEVSAAYARLEAELRVERRGWLYAVAAAALLTVLFGIWWVCGYVLSEPQLRQGTASVTRQLHDDERHVVYQVVELDDGRSIVLFPGERLAPIGSRVVVSERMTLWGRTQYTLVRLANDRATRGH